jgi:hypothetical protein
MIIVRVGLTRERALSGGATDQSAYASHPLGFRHSRPPYSGPSLAVEITQFIETDGDMSENTDAVAIELKMKPTDTESGPKA